jgi:hypothetical protein
VCSRDVWERAQSRPSHGRTSRWMCLGDAFMLGALRRSRLGPLWVSAESPRRCASARRMRSAGQLMSELSPAGASGCCSDQPLWHHPAGDRRRLTDVKSTPKGTRLMCRRDEQHAAGARPRAVDWGAAAPPGNRAPVRVAHERSAGVRGVRRSYAQAGVITLRHPGRLSQGCKTLLEQGISPC